MRKLKPILAIAVLVLFAIPSIASAAVHQGDLVITKPGFYSNLEVTGSIIIMCPGVTLQGVSASSVVLDAPNAGVIIGGASTIGTLTVNPTAEGASVIVAGAVESMDVLAANADIASSPTGAVTTLAVAESAVGSTLLLGGTFTNVQVNAPSVTAILPQTAVLTNVVIAPTASAANIVPFSGVDLSTTTLTVESPTTTISNAAATSGRTVQGSASASINSVY